MKWALKLIPVEQLINYLINWLASTIKRPNSPEAQRVLSGVRLLRGACDRFLEEVEI